MTPFTTKLKVGEDWSYCTILNPDAEIDWVGETSNPEDATRLVACWNAFIDVPDTGTLPSVRFLLGKLQTLTKLAESLERKSNATGKLFYELLDLIEESETSDVWRYAEKFREDLAEIERS